MALDKIKTAMIEDAAVTAAKAAADVATQAELDAAAYDDNKIQTNLALLAFKTAVNGSLAKYNLQDQIVDEFVTNAGVDASASTNEVLTAGVYSTTTTAKATGGTITNYGAYQVHTFLIAQTGNSFTPASALNVDYLVVAGGAGGHAWGGGGGGGFRTAAALAVTAQAYTITVGAGGAVNTAGGNSTFSSITSTGGGTGASAAGAGSAGGSGGGGGYSSGAGGAASPAGQGNAGGVGGGLQSTGELGGGGGGGAGAVGGNATSQTIAGAGGIGEDEVMGLSAANSYTLLGNASAGHDSGGARYFSGGGGGGGDGRSGVTLPGAGGLGGGGAAGNAATATAGTAGTGGGGGAGGYATGGYNTQAAGGSGIVIIRYIGTATDLTLQSLDTEAETQPDYADMVMLIEDSGSGVGVVQTHIKGWISRDSGTTFTQGTLVDEGDWGTNKRILAFHDLDISAQPADKTMCYKITTHSSSAVYDTKIHATSIGWR